MVDLEQKARALVDAVELQWLGTGIRSLVEKGPAGAWRGRVRDGIDEEDMYRYTECSATLRQQSHPFKKQKERKKDEICVPLCEIFNSPLQNCFHPGSEIWWLSHSNILVAAYTHHGTLQGDHKCKYPPRSGRKI